LGGKAKERESGNPNLGATKNTGWVGDGFIATRNETKPKDGIQHLSVKLAKKKKKKKEQKKGPDGVGAAKGKRGVNTIKNGAEAAGHGKAGAHATRRQKGKLGH